MACAFSDFKGYENWQVVAVSQTEDLLKVMVANPTMIDAYRSRRARQRQAFPRRLQDREDRVEPEEEHGGPFFVRVPDTLQDVVLIEKDSKRFPATSGWAYAVFENNPASDTFDAVNNDRAVNCGYSVPYRGGEPRTTSSPHIRRGEPRAAFVSVNPEGRRTDQSAS